MGVYGIMRVVIADDNIKLANGVKATIEKHFPELFVEKVFYDGRTLMDYLDKNIPDLLITDIQMNGYSGLDACRHIRDNSSTAQIIIITGHEKFSYAKQAISCGVCELLSKPFNNRILIEAVIKAINASVFPMVTYFYDAICKVSMRDFLKMYHSQLQSYNQRQLLFLLEETKKHLAINCEVQDMLDTDVSKVLLAFSERYYALQAHVSITKQAKMFIRENYHDINLSRTMVADHLNISVAHLSTVFNKEGGIGLSDYITKVRIEHAKTLLLETNLSIRKIAEQTGFTSDKYFSQKFNEFVGVKPTQYQKVKTNEEN